MTTSKAHIIKINPLQLDLKSALQQIYKHYNGTHSDITVIVKPQTPSCQAPSNSQSRSRLDTNKQYSRDMHLSTDRRDRNIANGRNQCPSDQSRSYRLFSECMSRRKGNNITTNMEEIQANFNLTISTNNILPDVVVTEKQQKCKPPKARHNKRNSLEITCEQGTRYLQVQVESKQQASSNEQNNSNSTPHDIPSIKILPLNVPKHKQTQLHQRPLTFIQPSVKAPESEPSSNTQRSSSILQESEHESMFVVEERLNDAVSYIKKNKLFELEEYLYDFKIKYRKFSDRVQVKWKLLMAHCKENRKQYERASILYQQILDMAETKPKLMLVDCGDIYHRLGICYAQIKRWNDGIKSYANALKEYRKNDMNIKFAECLNNLGTLYLTACKIEQAEQCFLHSYEIKKSQYGHNSRKVIPCILNLFQCNILIHNYEQANVLLQQFQSILINLKEYGMLTGGLYRRRGKLCFLQGNLEQAQTNYYKGLDLLSSQYPYSLEYGQLCHNLAIVKLEKGQTQQARQLLNNALSRLTFYYTKDSAAIVNIKSNLKLVEKLQANTKNHNFLHFNMMSSKLKQI